MTRTDCRRCPLVGVALAAATGRSSRQGSGLSYSNTNYLLLAMILEAATGRSFASELRRRILAPLALRHTTFPTTSRIAGAHVHGYLPGDEPADATALSPTLARCRGGDDLDRPRRRALLPGPPERPAARAGADCGR